MISKATIISLALIGTTLLSLFVTVNNVLINGGPYYQYQFSKASNDSDFNFTGFNDFLHSLEPNMMVKSDLNNNGSEEIIFCSKSQDLNISMYSDNLVHTIYSLPNSKFNDYYPSIITGNFANNSQKEIIVGFRRNFIANPSFINDTSFYSLILLEPTSNNLSSWKETPLPIQDKYIIALASIPNKNSTLDDLIISEQNQDESDLVLIHNMNFSNPEIIDKVVYGIDLPRELSFSFTPSQLYFQHILPVPNNSNLGYNLLVTGNNELREYQNANGTWSKHIIDMYTGSQLFSGLININFGTNNTYIVLSTYSYPSIYQIPFLAIYKQDQNNWSKVEQINSSFHFLGLNSFDSLSNSAQKLLVIEQNYGDAITGDQLIVDIYSWDKLSNQLVFNNAISIGYNQANTIWNVVGSNNKVYTLGDTHFLIISIVDSTNTYIMFNSLYLLGILLLFSIVIVFSNYSLRKTQISTDKINLILIVISYLFFSLSNYFFNLIKTPFSIPSNNWIAYLINSLSNRISLITTPQKGFFDLVIPIFSVYLGIGLFLFIYEKNQNRTEKIFRTLLVISGFSIFISFPINQTITYHFYISPFIGISETNVIFNTDLVAIVLSLINLLLSVGIIIYSYNIFSKWTNYSTNKVLKTIKGFYSLSLTLTILFLVNYLGSILIKSFYPELIGSIGFIIYSAFFTAIIIVLVNLFIATGQILEDFFSVNQINPINTPKMLKISFNSLIFSIITIAWLITSLMNYFIFTPDFVIDISSRSFYSILFNFLFSININSFLLLIYFIIGIFFIIFSLINRSTIDLGSTMFLGLGFLLLGFSFVSGLILILFSFVLLTEQNFKDDIKGNLDKFVQKYFKNINEIFQAFNNSNQIELARNTFKMLITDIEHQNRINFDLTDEEIEKYTQEGLKALHELKGGL